MYNIIRFYASGRKKIVKRNVSREEAEEHCSRPDSHKPGRWFDGFRKV